MLERDGAALTREGAELTRPTDDALCWTEGELRTEEPPETEPLETPLRPPPKLGLEPR